MTKWNLTVLWERDHGECWICNQSVPEPGSVHHSDPDAPTRDHVIQRRKGGTNGTENLRLAHRRCNFAREAPPVDTPIHHHLPRAWHHHLDTLPDDEPVDLDDLLDITLDLLDLRRPHPIEPDTTIGTRAAKAHRRHPIDTTRRAVHNLKPAHVARELADRLGQALTIHVADTNIGTLRRITTAKGHTGVPPATLHRLRTALHCTRILTERGAATDDIQLWFVHHADELHTAPLERIRALQPDDTSLHERVLHAAHSQNLN